MGNTNGMITAILNEIGGLKNSGLLEEIEDQANAGDQGAGDEPVPSVENTHLGHGPKTDDDG